MGSTITYSGRASVRMSMKRNREKLRFSENVNRMPSNGNNNCRCLLKFDGYRILAEIDGEVTLRTRNGADATKWFPEVGESLGQLKGGRYVFDGEICVLDEPGRSDFDRLQDRARRRGWYKGADPVVYCVFDLLANRGVDVTAQPLIQRKAALAKVLKRPLASIMYVSHFPASQAAAVFEQDVIALKAEGLVAKRETSLYQPGVRSGDWVKFRRKARYLQSGSSVIPAEPPFHLG
jgi:bifunctional non-homologous end joining protein LigD